MSHREHGTRAKYVVDKCRCDDCREASRVAESERRRQRAYGIPAYVDAEPARQHVRQLGEQGMGWKRVAEAAGLNSSLVWKLLYGDRSRNLPPSRRVRPSTAEALLAVQLDIADGALIDATGTRRRAQALACLGYSLSYLAEQMGIQRESFIFTIENCAQVQKRTADRVRELYDQLSMTPRAAADKYELGSITRTKTRAAYRMWVPPLGWDEDTIDDPFAEPSTVYELDVEDLDELGPDVDDVAVQRRLDGDRSVTLNRAEQVEAARRWENTKGGTWAEFERVTGLNFGRLRQEVAA